MIHSHSGHSHSGHSHSSHSHAGHSHSSADEQLAADSTVELSEQAKRNLKLSSKRAFPQNFWKRIVIPGEIMDRPGLSDRSLTSPISGVITHVHVQQGDIVKPGDRIATVRLVSGYLQQAQSDLFKAVRETEIASKEINRIQAMVDRGIVPEKRVIMLQQEIERQRSQIDATYQDLVTRLPSKRIQKISFLRFKSWFANLVIKSNLVNKSRCFRIINICTYAAMRLNGRLRISKE